MAKRKNPSPSSSSSDRRQWQRIFSTLSHMLKSQHSQIEALADDRSFLEKYIHLQHDYWSSTSSLLESYVAQLKREEVKRRKMDEAKLDVMVGLKQREAFCYKKQLELAETELEDFRTCVEALSPVLSELKGKLNARESVKAINGGGGSRSTAIPNEEEHHRLTLEGEIKKLKVSYKKLSAKKEAEVSSLLAEKDFVWNQLKRMESTYSGVINSKRTEVEHANEALAKLQHNLEDLQASVTAKDETISQLNARMELDRRRYAQEAEKANEKINQLQLDVEELQSLVREKDGAITKLRSGLATSEMGMDKSTVVKSHFSKGSSSQSSLGNASVTRTEQHSRKGSRKRSSKSAKDDSHEKHTCIYDGSSRLQVSAPAHGLQCGSITRRTRTRTRMDSSIEEPLLFHANFKVPKLKNSSPSAAVQ